MLTIVILYLFYNAGLLEVADTKRKEIAIGFIDDVVFLAAGPNLEHSHCRIADMMERPRGGLFWSSMHNSLFEPDKLQLVDFTRKRKPSRQPGQCTSPLTHPPLTLRAHTITPTQSCKYLGIILDQEL